MTALSEWTVAELEDEVAWHLLVEVQVEGVQRLVGVTELRLLAPAFQQPIGATRELVLDQVGQSLACDQQGRRNGGTQLYDAILLASDDLMKKQEGRKALVLLTDGVDTGSKVI